MSNYAPSAFSREIIARLRGYIARYDLNQADLAVICDVSQSQFSKILRGLRPLTVDQLAAICVALDLEVEALVADVEAQLADREELASPVSYVSEGARRRAPHHFAAEALDDWAAAVAMRFDANVRALPDDLVQVTPEGPAAGYALAARRGLKKANQPHAE